VETALPNATTVELNASQRRELERFGERLVHFGVNFAVVTPDGQISVLSQAGAFESDSQELVEAGREACVKAVECGPEGGDIPVWQFADAHLFLAVPLLLPPAVTACRVVAGAAVMDLGEPSGAVSCATTPAAGRSGERTEYLTEMLRLVAQNLQTALRTEEQIEVVGVELARVYEELVLLHKISTNMRVTEADANFLSNWPATA
jgi:hypothetical protein